MESLKPSADQTDFLNCKFHGALSCASPDLKCISRASNFIPVIYFVSFTFTFHFLRLHSSPGEFKLLAAQSFSLTSPGTIHLTSQRDSNSLSSRLPSPCSSEYKTVLGKMSFKSVFSTDIQISSEPPNF